ncbi:MAG: LSm family protein [Methanobacterium sp.]
MVSKSDALKIVSKTENLFYNELKNFIGKNVTVTLINGHKIHSHLIAIEFNDLNFIIEHSDGVKEMIRGESIQSVRLGSKIEKE